MGFLPVHQLLGDPDEILHVARHEAAVLAGGEAKLLDIAPTATAHLSRARGVEPASTKKLGDLVREILVEVELHTSTARILMRPG